MKLIPLINIRIKENKGLIKILKNINKSEKNSYNHEVVKQSFNSYLHKDKKIAELVKKENQIGNQLQKKIFEHLIGQTYLIKEYAKYQLKYRLPKN